MQCLKKYVAKIFLDESFPHIQNTPDKIVTRREKKMILREMQIKIKLEKTKSYRNMLHSEIKIKLIMSLMELIYYHEW